MDYKINVDKYNKLLRELDEIEKILGKRWRGIGKNRKKANSYVRDRIKNNNKSSANKSNTAKNSTNRRKNSTNSKKSTNNPMDKNVDKVLTNNIEYEQLKLLI